MGNEMFNDEQLAYLKDQAKAADLAAARREAEDALADHESRWPPYCACCCCCALRSLLAATAPARGMTADLIALAVNALPALLDVAEAAMNDMEEDAALGRGVDTALAEALARLEEVLP